MSLISHCEFAQRENQNISNFLDHVFSQLIVKCFFGAIQVGEAPKKMIRIQKNN